MEASILGRQLATSATSVFQLLQPILWFLEWASHSHNCLIVVPSISTLTQWTNNNWTTALCKARCLLCIYCEELLSNEEASWLLESEARGTRLVLLSPSQQCLSRGWAYGRHLISAGRFWNYKFPGLVLCWTVLVVWGLFWVHPCFEESQWGEGAWGISRQQGCIVDAQTCPGVGVDVTVLETGLCLFTKLESEPEISVPTWLSLPCCLYSCIYATWRSCLCTAQPQSGSAVSLQCEAPSARVSVLPSDPRSSLPETTLSAGRLPRACVASWSCWENYCLEIFIGM